jgi:hypothetical protein
MMIVAYLVKRTMHYHAYTMAANMAGGRSSTYDSA